MSSSDMSQYPRHWDSAYSTTGLVYTTLFENKLLTPDRIKSGRIGKLYRLDLKQEYKGQDYRIQITLRKRRKLSRFGFIYYRSHDHKPNEHKIYIDFKEGSKVLDLDADEFNRFMFEVMYHEFVHVYQFIYNIPSLMRHNRFLNGLITRLGGAEGCYPYSQFLYFTQPIEIDAYSATYFMIHRKGEMTGSLKYFRQFMSHSCSDKPLLKLICGYIWERIYKKKNIQFWKELYRSWLETIRQQLKDLLEQA